MPDASPTPSPPPEATPDRSVDERRAEVDEARRRAERARLALVEPWSRQRARRVGLVALVLVVLGPIVGTAVALLLVPADPGAVLEIDESTPAVLDVRGTVRGVDPATGEVTVQLVVDRAMDPAADESGLFTDDGDLAEDVELVVNDARGQEVVVLPAGSPPGTVSATVPLVGSRATRYPVDRYQATLLVVATAGGDEERPVPVRLALRSTDPGFTVDVADDASEDGIAVVHLQVDRRATVIGWAGFFVLVCWLLAIAAASIGWTTVVHGIATPAWAWGFLIGVLFALPPLRNALPGAPPSGSLVDLAAFYWAVGIVALTLVAMIGSWNLRVRRAPQEPDAPRPRV